VPPRVRPPERRIFALLPLLLAAVMLSAPARAADSPQSQLEEVEKALEASRTRQADLQKQAEALANELAGLRQDEIAAARAAQAHEATLNDLEARLGALAGEEQAKTVELGRERAKQAQLLMALEGLAVSPPEGLLLAPGRPVDALRGAMLMGAAVEPIEERARDLKRRLDALATVRAEIAETRDQHRAEGDALAVQRGRIAALIERKTALQRQASAGAAESGLRQQQLAAQASDLRDLVDGIEREVRKQEADRREAARKEAARIAAERRAAATRQPAAENKLALAAPPPAQMDPTKPRNLRPFAESRGAVVFPAMGAIVRRFGEPDELGVATKGMSLETRPGAEVVAPFDGQVMFAGPFRGYGHILIIGHGDGYHSLLAGLDRVDCSVGQWLVAGEPVGAMPGGTEKPRLYLELRHNNQPINPLPWLVTHAEKVNG